VSRPGSSRARCPVGGEHARGVIDRR
jgi:hypothetical protein